MQDEVIQELIEVLMQASEHLTDHIDGLPPQMGVEETKERIEALIEKFKQD